MVSDKVSKKYIDRRESSFYRHHTTRAEMDFILKLGRKNRPPDKNQAMTRLELLKAYKRAFANRDDYQAMDPDLIIEFVDDQIEKEAG